MTLVIFFDNWDKIMIVVSVFQLLSCVAVPIAFCKLRKVNPDGVRPFRMPGGIVLSFFVYLVVTYLLAQCGFLPLFLSLVFHAVFFSIYCCTHHRSLNKSIKAAASSWSLFAYMAVTSGFGYLQEYDMMNSIPVILSFVAVVSIIYYYMLNQKGYNNNQTVSQNQAFTP